MNIDRFTRCILTLIALFLGIIALRPWFQSATVEARDSYSSSENGFSVFVEPGVTTLHASDGSKHVIGKVVVDLKTGNIWGFQTTNDLPYARGGIARPIYLGKYDFAAMERPH